MLRASQQNALHKSVMMRVLIGILDDSFLSSNLFFKGGSCASMLGYLDRFSVDLDFDVKDKSFSKEIAQKMEGIFEKLNLIIKDSSKNTLQYYLKYEAPPNVRNTLKIDAVEEPYQNNKYETLLLPEINRYAQCQTKDTLFANKMVAFVERFEKTGSLAGRDLYDIYHFLLQGFEQ